MGCRPGLGTRLSRDVCKASSAREHSQRCTCNQVALRLRLRLLPLRNLCDSTFTQNQNPMERFGAKKAMTCNLPLTMLP
jgi:hypothetical protein